MSNGSTGDWAAEAVLIHWPGDAASLVAEMKRRAGVTTDRQLATLVKRTQTAISHWKRNNSVPHEVLLEFDAVVRLHRQGVTSVAILAGAIAIRSAGFLFERAAEEFGTAPRWPFYSMVAIGFHPVSDALAQVLLDAVPGDQPIYQLGEALLADEGFLVACGSWITELAEFNVLGREPITAASMRRLGAIVQAAIWRHRSPHLLVD